MVRVLVVEDEPDLAETLHEALAVDGFVVDVAGDGRRALDLLETQPFDLVVLDRDLPEVSGDEVCRLLIERESIVRILMLTASADLADRVSGLERGADDYLAKPFAYAELVARLRALARRSGRADGSVVVVGALRIDVTRRIADVDGFPVALTPKEFSVLEALALHAGAGLSAERLLAMAWAEPYERTVGAVRVVVHSLRRKLGPALRIESAPGYGYRLERP
ncbi:two-component system regulatory protein [Leifsonia xyli subsp. cynodontis DSM 46306]|jgi:DNA-binding response OmpR family regulator|uniref:DNA-binding response regulator n=1 Tax=Leifsonia xyli subsp. cynodontis DSM 46306 TaxID=1389489 RepID=U3PBN0_LEIXC|nr:response regulator transcription factor [Leifsonia xyli]AGW42147.1 two-component system regulatory protein [Leifsonia xyli subsp. cynodontis DSM 46306]